MIFLYCTIMGLNITSGEVVMFPGQGSQFKGMGKSLFPLFKRETQIASDCLGYDIEELCISDPNKELVLTQFTQPALYTVNSFNYLHQKKGYNPDYAIGHSLGEYNALMIAGAFDFETGLRLVQKRGQLMSEASGGGMAAIVGAHIDVILSFLDNSNLKSLDIANYNTPKQTVISGPKDDIEKAVQLFKKDKIRSIVLSVSAPFHSRYMKSASEEYAEFIKDFTFNDLKIPVISNVSGLPYQNEDIKSLLCSQISGSVKWTDTIHYLLSNGVGEFKEIGGNILTKMVNDIKRDFKLPKNSVNGASNSGNPEDPTPIPQQASKPNLVHALGSQAFKDDYNLKYTYVAGTMCYGTTTHDMVVKMSRAGLLSFLESNGSTLSEVESRIKKVLNQLNTDQDPFGMNLTHDIYNPEHEMKMVDLFLNLGIKTIEATGYLSVTSALVYFRLKGLQQDLSGKVKCRNSLLVKVSKPEVAEVFMQPAPLSIVEDLVKQNLISSQQADWSKQIPLSHDICVEVDNNSDEGNSNSQLLFSTAKHLRDNIQDSKKYAKTIRVGLSGDIGTPESAASAYILGADFILTDALNQCTAEAATSEEVKRLLQGIKVGDLASAPLETSFELGGKLQVLKRGVLFPNRANRLYDLYTTYDSLESIPKHVIEQLEKNYFNQTLAERWEKIKMDYTANGKKSLLDAISKDGKRKMATIFKSYLRDSHQTAVSGDLSNKINFQIHTKPALGAFNQWVKGTNLESWQNRHADDIGIKIMNETGRLLASALSKFNNQNQ